jgi:hypothetical protein
VDVKKRTSAKIQYESRKACVRYEFKVLGLVARVRMVIKGFESVGGNPRKSQKAHASQEFMEKSKNMHEPKVEGSESRVESSCRSRRSRECKEDSVWSQRSEECEQESAW